MLELNTQSPQATDFLAIPFDLRALLAGALAFLDPADLRGLATEAFFLVSAFFVGLAAALPLAGFLAAEALPLPLAAAAFFPLF